MSTELYPLTLEPIIAEQFWGRPDSSFYEDGPSSDYTFGTIWMATENSKVGAGPQTGRNLGYLKQRWGRDLIGSASEDAGDRSFPVELKLKRTGSASLTAALNADSLWYVLGAGEGGYLHAGYLPGLNIAAIAERAGGDPARWADSMPRYQVEEGQTLFLPALAPLILGPGLTMAQISPPAESPELWPLPGYGEEAVRRAAETGSPVWISPRPAKSGLIEIFQSESLQIHLVTSQHFSAVTVQEAATFIWPLFGQARIRCRGPASTTRLQQGRITLLPSSLGHYSVESSGAVGYLLIEAF